jgi:chromosome segregation ATPase
MANPAPPPNPAPPASQSPAANPLTEEERVAAQRLKNLEEQASRAATEVQTARADLAAAKGDLDRANAANATLREENERLKTQLVKQTAAAAKSGDLPALPVPLPKAARQLTESVTIATLTEHAAPVRATAKRGDVVIVGEVEDAEELQAKIGTLVRVYAVEKATAAELATLGHVA